MAVRRPSNLSLKETRQGRSIGNLSLIGCSGTFCILSIRACLLCHAVLPCQPCSKHLFHAADLVGQPEAAKIRPNFTVRSTMLRSHPSFHRPSTSTNFCLVSKNISQLAFPPSHGNFSDPKYLSTITNAWQSISQCWCSGILSPSV